MKLSLLIAILFCTSSVFAFKKITPQEYIEMYKDDAIKEMHRSGVPASITLAQGMLESGYGNSALARKAKNHFGIKCHSDWNGATFKMDDDRKNECFRKYKSVWHSYRDHSDFLKGKKRYAFLFELKMTDYKGWCRGLKKAGYATNKKYASLLISMIERFDLNQFVEKLSKRQKRKRAEQQAEIKAKEEVEIKNDPNRKDARSEEEGQDDFEISVGESEVLQSEHWVKYVKAKKGDTYFSIAKRNNISLKRLYKYNECNADTVLQIGAPIYLQPKRNRGTQVKYKFVQGDNLYEISQRFGIKLKHLYRRNNYNWGYEPKPGEVVYLKGRKK